jgi:hypothetical protein
MTRRFFALVASALMVLGLSLPAAAGPLAYTPVPLDTVQGVIASYNQALNANVPTMAVYQTVTGAAGAATLNSVKGAITTEALSTAASGTYTETLTNSSIAANSIVLVTVANGTSTTGQAAVATVTPAAGSAVIKVQNVSTGAALNGTLVISFLVIN